MINGKIVVHLRAPVMTQSGYGAHAREIINYFLADEKYIVALESINWGNCGYLHKKDFKDEQTFHQYRICMGVYEQLKDKGEFDLAVHVSIPNEFSRTAKICVGVTAGIETDRVAREWILKCNEMDLIVVPSEHSAKVLAGTVYEIRNNKTGEVHEERMITPISIIPEYFERPEEIKPLEIEFSTNKNLLFVGLWGGKGGFGEDRKNISDLIKLFIHTFKDDPSVGLILKTQLVNGSARDRVEVEKRIVEIKNNFGPNVKCKIHLIHQDLTEDEMWGLYSHPQVTGMVSLTHGEGFGRPLLEAAAVGKPVLATSWSGHLDFLKKKSGFIPFEFSMVQVPECQVWEGVVVSDSHWAKVDDKDVIKRMKKFLESSTLIKNQAEAHVSWLDKKFSKAYAESEWDRFFGHFIKPAEENISKDVAPEYAQYEAKKQHAADALRALIDSTSTKKKVLYVMPQSAGDCLISTSIIHSLILSRHWDTDFDFYIATTPPFQPLFNKLKEGFGLKVIDYNHELMFNAEITREVFDFVYTPGVNVQFTFSNWLLGNGEYSVRLLEEFAKNCNLHPQEIINYQAEVKTCDIPNSDYIVIAPGGQKSSKTYKQWPDVVFNLKEMIPGIKLVQVGSLNEDLLEGVLDYRGKEFSESFYIIKNAVMLIGCDSFPAHAAAAMATPHLIIYASTHASTCAPLMIRKRVPQIAIEESEICQPKCYKDQCMKMKDGKNCLSHINPESICLGVQRIIEKINEEELEELEGKDIE